MPTVVLHCPRGGAGTSSLALATAMKLADRVGSACLVELSTFGSAIPLLKLPDHAGWGVLAQVLGTGSAGEPDFDARFAGALDEALVHVPGGTGRLTLLPACAAVMDRLGAEEVESVLTALARTNEYVVVDTPAELSERTAAALVEGGPALLLHTADIQCVYRLLQLRSVLEQLLVDPGRVLLVGLGRSGGGPDLPEVAHLLPYRVAGQVPEEKNLAATASRESWTGFRRKGPADQAVDRIVELIVSGSWALPSPHPPERAVQAHRRNLLSRSNFPGKPPSR